MGVILTRTLGPYAPMYWMLILCNVVLPQLLWSKRLRQNLGFLFAISIVVNVGMWLERFVIIVTSLHRSELPAAWGMYSPTRWEFMTFFGSIGLFFTLLFLFVRVLPMISIFETRQLVAEHEEK